MGGSFVQKGGHNILEVAQLGKAVIFGSDMRSFEDEAELFLQYEAGIQCNLNQLTGIFNRLVEDNKYKQDFEKNTLILINSYKNIVDNYYNNIKIYF